MKRIIVLALMTLTAGTARADELVTFVSGYEYQIRADSDEARLEIPLRAQPEVWERLELTLLDVAADERQAVELRNRFELSLDERREQLGVRVVLKPPPPPPATYTLRIRFTTTATRARGKKPDVKSEIETLKITVPPANVGTTGAFRIQQVRSWVGADEIEGNELPLRETSRKSRVTGLVVEQLSIDSSNDSAVGARIVFGETSTVPPGGMKLLEASTSGFPIGIVKGRLLVTGNELAAPVEVPFEVTTRAAEYWLFVALLVGLVFGFVMRTGLQHRIRLDEQRVQASDLGRRIDVAIDRYPDEIFEEAAKDAKKTLRDALSHRDSQRIEIAVKEAEAELKSALKNLEERRVEVQAELRAMADSLTASFELPDAIARERDDMLASIENLFSALNAGDIESVRKKARFIGAEMNAKLVEAARPWANDIGQRLRQLGPRTDELSSLLEEAEGLADGLDEGAPEPEALFEQIDSLRSAVRNVLEQLVRHLAETFGGVKSALRTDDGLLTAEDVIEQLERELRSSGSAPETVLVELPSHLEVFFDGLARAIRAASDESEVDALLESGAYVEAARKAASSTPAARERVVKDEPAGSAPSDEDRIIVLGGKQLSPSAQHTTRWVVRDQVPIQPPSTLEIVRAEALQSLAAAKLAQTVLSAVLIAIFGYILFHDGFTGTPEDFAMAFSWAFGIDIGLEAVTDLAKKRAA